METTTPRYPWQDRRSATTTRERPRKNSRILRTHHDDPRPPRILTQTIRKSRCRPGRTLQGIFRRSFTMNVVDAPAISLLQKNHRVFAVEDRCVLGLCLTLGLGESFFIRSSGLLWISVGRSRRSSSHRSSRRVNSLGTLSQIRMETERWQRTLNVPVKLNQEVFQLVFETFASYGSFCSLGHMLQCGWSMLVSFG